MLQKLRARLIIRIAKQTHVVLNIIILMPYNIQTNFGEKELAYFHPMQKDDLVLPKPTGTYFTD